QELQPPDAVGDDAPEHVRGGVVDAFGELTGKHRSEWRIGVALAASGEREGDVATALQIRGALRDDLEDALVLGCVVDRGKRSRPRRDAQIAEQPVRAETREPHAVQGGEWRAAKREHVHLGAGRVARKLVERVLPVFANRLIVHAPPSRRWRAKNLSTIALWRYRPASWPWPS